QRVLLQVNVAREPQKSGCAPEEAPALARDIAALSSLRLEGLMTLAPFTDDVDVQRRTFRGLRVLRDRIKEEEGLWLGTLSMGMNEALVAAQQLRQDTRAAAEREGQVIVREAEAEAKRLLDEARSAENVVQAKMAETERQFQQYMGGFRALLERQLAELRALDGGGG